MKKNINIQYLTTLDITGFKASSIQTRGTCEELSKISNLEVLFPNLNQKFTKKPNVKYTSVNFIRSKKDKLDYLSRILFSSLQFAFKIKKGRVIYSRDIYSLFFTSILKKLGIINNVLIYEFHNIYFYQNRNKFLKKIIKLVELFTINQCDGVMSITKRGLNELKKYINFDKKHSKILPSGVDINKFDIKYSKKECRKKLDLPSNKNIICYLGNLYHWKGVNYFLDSAKYFDENTIFLVAGGFGKQLSEYKKKYKKKNIIFAGQIEHKKAPLYLRASDILVLPNGKNFMSDLFTSPTKLFEYMVSKTPIVASDLPIFKETLKEDSAHFFKSENVFDLASKIKIALKDSKLSHKFSLNSYKLVLPFSWENRAKKIVELSLKILKSKN